jgi:hypothetical protein
VPVGIVAAAAGLRVKQLTGDAGWGDIARVLILKPDQATQAAAITQRLPFAGIHLVQRFCFPKRFVLHDQGVLNASQPNTKQSLEITSGF